MRLFRRQADALESELRGRKREPRDEFVDQIVHRVSANGTRPRLQLALGVAVVAVIRRIRRWSSRGERRGLKAGKETGHDIAWSVPTRPAA